MSLPPLGLIQGGATGDVGAKKTRRHHVAVPRCIVPQAGCKCGALTTFHQSVFISILSASPFPTSSATSKPPVKQRPSAPLRDLKHSPQVLGHVLSAVNQHDGQERVRGAVLQQRRLPPASAAPL